MQKSANIVTEKGLPFAKPGPKNKKICTGKILAAVLAGVELPAEEAAAWHRDLQAAREARIPPTDKWE